MHISFSVMVPWFSVKQNLAAIITEHNKKTDDHDGKCRKLFRGALFSNAGVFETKPSNHEAMKDYFWSVV